MRGQVLILAIVVIGLVLMSTVALISGSIVFSQNTKYSVGVSQAINLAEAGMDKAVAALNAKGGAYFGQGETVLGPGSFEVSITTLQNGAKMIESTGYVPSKAKAKVKRTVKATTEKGIGAAFFYGIQVGEGGLVMSENSQVIGSVYANGNIDMQNNAKITGDAYVAGGIQPIADQQSVCIPPDCGDLIFGTNVNGSEKLDIAQSFQPTTDSVLNKVKLRLKKYGSPPDIVVRILGDSNGKPNKNNVLSSTNLIASQVTGSYSFTEVIFSSPPLLTANTHYWIMLDTSLSSTNYWAWSYDSLQGYIRGAAVWSDHWLANSASWNSINGDLDFDIYMGGVPTHITGSNGAVIGGDAHANTLNNLNITGDAYYQVSQNITAANHHSGSPDPPAQAFPISDSNILEWKELAQSSGIHTGNISTCPSTLAAGKYVGDITLPSNCNVTINSPIWITGNLSLSNNNVLRLNSSYGPSSGVIIVDNFINFDNGNRALGSGITGSYLLLISEFNSRDDPTHRYAISINNSGNSGVIYSNLGNILVTNNNNMTEITSWKLTLMNNVIVQYDQGLANSFFTSGPSGAYSLMKGTYQLK